MPSQRARSGPAGPCSRGRPTYPRRLRRRAATERLAPVVRSLRNGGVMGTTARLTGFLAGAILTASAALAAAPAASAAASSPGASPSGVAALAAAVQNAANGHLLLSPAPST